jgi:aspartyl-tRNA synthetase
VGALRRGLRSRAYDAVYNGNELASGSVRIHDQELQRASSARSASREEEAREKFGFLLEAFRSARRRTPASPSGSTGWRCCSRGARACAT